MDTGWVNDLGGTVGCWAVFVSTKSLHMDAYGIYLPLQTSHSLSACDSLTGWEPAIPARLPRSSKRLPGFCLASVALRMALRTKSVLVQLDAIAMTLHGTGMPTLTPK